MRCLLMSGLLICLFNLWGKPVLKVEPAKLEFGSFAAKEARNGEYILQNTSQTVLNIKAARSTCNCAKVEFPGKIAPGESAKVKLHISENSYSGKFSGKIYLINDTNELLFTLIFEGKAEPLYIIEPSPEVYLGKIHYNSNFERKFILTPKKENIKLGSFRTDANFPINVEMHQKLDNCYEIAIKTQKINSNDQQVKFSVEIPILSPKGWNPVKFNFAGLLTP